MTFSQAQIKGRIKNLAKTNQADARILMRIYMMEEIIEGPLRKSLYGYPEIALRELLANIMVHQALDQRGTNPMVEFFFRKNRIFKSRSTVDCYR